MKKVGNITKENESGYISDITLYEAKNCTGCPLKGLCHKAKENRRIEVNHKLNEYRKKARELLTSEEGIFHRRRRSIEPESVFGQTKANKHYARFHHFDLELIEMDFAVFALAFNIGKLWNYKEKAKKIAEKYAKNQLIVLFLLMLNKKSAPDRKQTPRRNGVTLRVAA